MWSLLLVVALAGGCRGGVPVLLWESSALGDKEDLVPALFQLDSDEFSSHLEKRLRLDPLVVLFLEESLSVEDLSWKESFPLLRNITASSAKTELVTSVYEPVSALKDLAESRGYTWRKYDGSSPPKSVLEVRLDDPSPDEDRPDLLRRHDVALSQVYSGLLARHPAVLALLTGRYSSWVEPEYNRVRRDVDEVFNITTQSADGTYTIIQSSMAPTFFREENNGTVLDSVFQKFQDSKKDQNSLIVKFSDQTRVKFSFLKTGKSWKLSGATLNEKDVLTPSVDISRPIGMAFKSESPVEFSKGPTRLRFKDLTIQAFSEQEVFSPHPPIYFTIPILTGIFITFILGIILSWAIIMMMDIRTMDRFDDPKGKTITVAQGE